jgi:hypothetical protein
VLVLIRCSFYFNYFDVFSKDWEYLLSSDHHRHFDAVHGHTLGLTGAAAGGLQRVNNIPTKCIIDTSAPLFTQIATVLYALHLVYEVTQQLLSDFVCDEFHWPLVDNAA